MLRDMAVADPQGIKEVKDGLPNGQSWFLKTNTGLNDYTDYDFNGNRKEGNLLDYNARHMEPGMARFLQADTVIPDADSAIGFNRYAYVRNNPANLTDPSGRKPAVRGSVSGGFIILTWYDEEGNVVRTGALSIDNPMEVDQARGLCFSAWTPGWRYDFATGAVSGPDGAGGQPLDLRASFPGSRGQAFPESRPLGTPRRCAGARPRA